MIPLAKENPKLVGTKILDCIPQTGMCPVGCVECYYNGPMWYRTRDEPLIPSKIEADGRVVRFNTGLDSNVEREKVIEASKDYEDFFFNTAIPRFDFPGPVVFTCNSKAVTKSAPADSIAYFADFDEAENLMYVRFRLNTWNVDLADEVVKYYADWFQVPVVMTFMRYSDENNIPEDQKSNYTYEKHIVNSYWLMKDDVKRQIMHSWADNGMVYMCGTYDSDLCRDCENCWNLYWRWKRLSERKVP